MPLDGFTWEPRRPRLRVALFSGNYNYTLDGANKALNRLSGHLEDVEGARVRVYSPTSPTPAFAPRGELISAPSVTIPTRRDYRFALGLTPEIRRDVEAFRPDIVHVSAPDLLGMGAIGLARRLGVPAVASVHTLFETYLAYYGLDWLRPAAERGLRAFYGSCDYVLTPTPAIAEQMKACGLTVPTRVWSRGVDRTLFDPARRSLPWRRLHSLGDDDAVVVFFGRLVMEKGLAVFADAVALLKSGGRRVKVLVIGDGPARAWMEEKLPDALFTGFLCGEALARAVASGDILLNPSRTETFCNVTLEAMASGLAVVGADAPNHRALLRDRESGWLCPADDARAYADAIAALMDHPGERMELGCAARAASAAYSWEQILSGVADVYREAIAARVASPAPGRGPAFAAQAAA